MSGHPAIELTVERRQHFVQAAHLGTPIASGRTAEVYAWGDGAVLKLFFSVCVAGGCGARAAPRVRRRGMWCRHACRVRNGAEGKSSRARVRASRWSDVVGKSADGAGGDGAVGEAAGRVSLVLAPGPCPGSFAGSKAAAGA